MLPKKILSSTVGQVCPIPCCIISDRRRNISCILHACTDTVRNLFPYVKNGYETSILTSINRYGEPSGQSKRRRQGRLQGSLKNVRGCPNNVGCVLGPVSRKSR